MCAELPLVAMGPGLALGLQISLEASDSPRWVSLGKGLGAVCLMPTDTRLRLTSLVLIWRRQEGEQLGVFLRARGKREHVFCALQVGRMERVPCMQISRQDGAPTVPANTLSCLPGPGV